MKLTPYDLQQHLRKQPERPLRRKKLPPKNNQVFKELLRQEMAKYAQRKH